MLLLLLQVYGALRRQKPSLEVVDHLGSAVYGVQPCSSQGCKYMVIRFNFKVVTKDAMPKHFQKVDLLLMKR